MDARVQVLTRMSTRAGGHQSTHSPYTDAWRVIFYPDDERHSVCERAMIGPTRLVYRNKQFEQAMGFEGLFD